MSNPKSLPPKEYQNSFLLLWDGECDFCRRSVEWLDRKAKGKFVPLPYQQQKNWLPAEIYADCRNQFYLRMPSGEYFGGGDALIKLFEIMDWKPLSFFLGLPGLRQMTRVLYRFIARRRDFFGKIFFSST